jgi:ADP-ribosyl-[dinitrogen reductase] hydrolase
MRLIAIDWSGSNSNSASKIWLAETRDGNVTRLECGRDRPAIVAHLIEEASRDPDLIVGLDFAFSLPSWFLTGRALPDAPALWELVAQDGEDWLRDCEPPFWGRPGKGFPDLAEHFRRTDRDVPAVGGIRPKSVFQIGGAGAVGTGSLRGMPALLALRNAGFAIWPFEAPRLPLVVEIYPRALTGGVNKGSRDARRDYLDRCYPDLPPGMRADAIASDDAFDALVSVLVMQEHVGELQDLEQVRDPQLLLEGAIWLPTVSPAAQPKAAHRTQQDGDAQTASGVRRSAASTPAVSKAHYKPPQPLENSYWLRGRRVLAGEYPGDRKAERARKRVRALLDAGITVFIDLTHDHELEPYHEFVEDEARQLGIRAYHIRLPIVDMNVPEEWEMRRILDVINLAEQAGEAVYVHCWGGVGRTGTVVGCILAEYGSSNDEALATVGTLFATTSEAKRQKHPEGSPQTAKQRQFVLDWPVRVNGPTADGDSRQGRGGTPPAAASVSSESPRRTGNANAVGLGQRISRRTRAHYRGCLLGVAAGDALGAPVEFLSLPEIRHRFGQDGVRDMEVAYGRRGAITDDTQMTLFTAEGLLRATVRERNGAEGNPLDALHHAYVRWLWTQGQSSAAKWERNKADGWLFSLPELHHRRAPGNTCLSALTRTRQGPAKNDSKGCGTVMRIAPVAMLSFGDTFELARKASALTHGHPTGQLAAATLAVLLERLFDGESLDDAVEGSICAHIDFAPDGETIPALRLAQRLSASEPPSPELVEQIGGGWTAEEALAIGVCCALAHPEDFAAGVRLAVNHSGDSDSTGSIAGAILGALNGVDAIPAEWLRELELRDVITQVADDLFQPDKADRERYPGW